MNKNFSTSKKKTQFIEKSFNSFCEIGNLISNRTLVVCVVLTQDRFILSRMTYDVVKFHIFIHLIIYDGLTNWSKIN